MFRSSDGFRTLTTVLMIAVLCMPFFVSSTVTAAPNLVNALTFASGQSNGAPQNSGSRFDAGISNIYAFIDLSGAQPNDVIKLVWYRGEHVLFIEADTANNIFNGSVPDSGSFWFKAFPTGGFQPGNYRVDVQVNDAAQRSGEFRVEPKQGEPTFVGVVFTDRASGPGDNVASPVTAIGNFPTSASKIYAVFDHFEMDSAQSWGWRLSREGVLIDQQQDQPWNGTAEGTYALPINLPGDSGVYDFDLYLNENWVSAESFVVGQPEIPQDRLIQSDDFTDPDSGWWTGQDGKDSAAYERGRYILNVVDGDDYWIVGGEFLENGVVQIQGSFIDVPSTVNEATGWGGYGYIGLVTRWQDRDNYYVFAVTPDGQYAIFHQMKGTIVWDTRWSLVPHDVLQPGLQVHTLRIMENGSVLRCYVDGLLVGLVPSAVWAKGESGVIAAAFTGTDHITAAFQDFSEWSLPQEASSN